MSDPNNPQDWLPSMRGSHNVQRGPPLNPSYDGNPFLPSVPPEAPSEDQGITQQERASGQYSLRKPSYVHPNAPQPSSSAPIPFPWTYRDYRVKHKIILLRVHWRFVCDDYTGRVLKLQEYLYGLIVGPSGNREWHFLCNAMNKYHKKCDNENIQEVQMGFEGPTEHSVEQQWANWYRLVFKDWPADDSGCTHNVKCVIAGYRGREKMEEAEIQRKLATGELKKHPSWRAAG